MSDTTKPDTFTAGGITFTKGEQRRVGAFTVTVLGPSVRNYADVAYQYHDGGIAINDANNLKPVTKPVTMEMTPGQIKELRRRYDAAEVYRSHSRASSGTTAQELEALAILVEALEAAE